MDKKNFKPRAVLAQNLKALMGAKVGPTSEMDLARRSGVAQATIGRIKRQEVASSIETVSEIAAAYGLEGWQLLVAGMDPTNPPVLLPVSKAERALYDRLRAAAEDIAKLK